MKNRSELLGACGLYCGACYHHRASLAEGQHLLEEAARQGRTLAGFSCQGCSSGVLYVHPGCSRCQIRACTDERAIEHCGLCHEFPCDRLQAFQSDGRVHHRDVLANLEELITNGPDGEVSMSDHVVRERRLRIWQTETELPPEVFEAWHKPDGAISPVAIVATVDPDGSPRTAPFGSLRAITPRLLRLFSWREHDTYANLCRDGWVSVALVSPDVAVSVTGQARVVREQAHHEEQFAIVDIDVEEVKNDMAYRIIVESGIEIVPKERHKPWHDAVMAELGTVEFVYALEQGGSSSREEVKCSAVSSLT